ncbi:MAG: hypothetical protein ABJH04_03055 [Cyclobacteriaceae bacterium]
MRTQLLKTLSLAGIAAVMLVSCEDLNEPIKPTHLPQTNDIPKGSVTPPGGQAGNPDSENGVTTIAKSYRTVSGNWVAARNYEYNSTGKVSKITWRSETPFVQTGSYTYEYDQEGKLSAMTDNFGDEEQFVWENGKVVRKNILTNGSIEEYKSYTYNEQGLLANAADYYLRHEGYYALRGVVEYLYYTDGNLYTSMYYVYNVNSNSFEFNSSKTYDSYIDSPNPFPMEEAIPGVVMQSKLPSSHSVTIGKQTINYSFSYELRSDGYPLSRFASSEYGNERTTYQYY